MPCSPWHQVWHGGSSLSWCSTPEAVLVSSSPPASKDSSGGINHSYWSTKTEKHAGLGCRHHLICKAVGLYVVRVSICLHKPSQTLSSWYFWLGPVSSKAGPAAIFSVCECLSVRLWGLQRRGTTEVGDYRGSDFIDGGFIGTTSERVGSASRL